MASSLRGVALRRVASWWTVARRAAVRGGYLLRPWAGRSPGEGRLHCGWPQGTDILRRFLGNSRRHNLTGPASAQPGLGNDCWLLEAETEILAGSNNRKPVGRAHLAQHAVNMILNGLLREIQLIRHLLVGEPALDQSDELLLSSAEPQTGSGMQAGKRRFMPYHPLK